MLLLIARPGAAQRPEPMSPSSSEAAADFVGTWEYRWGDSPREAAGSPRWAAPPAPADRAQADAGWRSLGRQAIPQPPGRAGNRFLWLRTPLDGPEVPEPTLYIGPCNQLLEAYVDGRLVYRWGQLDGDGPRARRFIGYPIHFIPLGADYRGRTLTLRIYSQHIIIGPVAAPRIGTKVRLIRDMLRRDIGRAAVGMVLAAVGLFVLALYLSLRQERTYLYYAGFALMIGIWLLCQMRSRTLFFDAPLLFTYVEFFALYIAVACLSQFMTLVLGRGPLGLMPFVSWIFIAFVPGAALLVATGVIGILRTIAIFEIGLLPVLVYLLGAVGVLLRQGNADARLFVIGFLTVILLGGYDVLATLGIFGRFSPGLSHYGQGIFVIALGLILVRRFRLLQADLVQTRQALSEKVHALEAHNAEINTLNEELRHQIEARSRQLITSLTDPASSASDVVPILADGSLLNGRYRVVRTIGQGAMGVVYEVERVHDGRRFAAKVLTGRARSRELARFAREAQLLARLKHKNLVSIADVDVTSTRLAYIIMELVDGTTLEALSARYTELDFALPVLRQLADALAKVHAEGVVHRDLKPANILVMRGAPGATPVIKVVDFGISALLGSDAADSAPHDRLSGLPAAQAEGVGPGDAAALIAAVGSTLQADGAAAPARPSRGDLLTQTGVIMGTPLYMAPELARGARLARPASDIFSYGIIAYQLVAGRLPSETPPVLLSLKPHARWYQPLAVLCPDLPHHIGDLIERCLDVLPENRPTAAELVAGLRA